jgi:hypothetical protein
MQSQGPRRAEQHLEPSTFAIASGRPVVVRKFVNYKNCKANTLLNILFYFVLGSLSFIYIFPIFVLGIQEILILL